MQKLIFFFLLLFANTSIFCQLAVWDWRVHFAYKTPAEIATDNKTVLCAFENGILEYDIEANETSIWSYTNALSDIKISTVFYDAVSESYWVGYENGNIDKIYRNTVYNIPALKLANVIGSKKINSFTQQDKMIYAVSDFGILVINPAKNEIKETYYTNNQGYNNLALDFLDDSIFVLTNKGLLKASENNPILADYGQWELIGNTEITSDTLNYTKMVCFDKQLVINKNKEGFGKDTVAIYKNGAFFPLSLDDYELKNLKTFDKQLFVIHQYGIVVLDDLFLTQDNFYRYPFSENMTPLTLTKTKKGEFFIGDDNHGVVRYVDNWNATDLSPNGPESNIFYRANSLKDEMIFSAGRIDKSGATYSSSGVYLFKDESWRYFSRFNQKMLDTFNVWDMNGIAINPRDNNEIAISACGDYPLLIMKDRSQISEIYGPANSILEVKFNQQDIACVTEVKYDKKGNLWMINPFGSKPLKVRTKDGVFYEFNTGSSTSQRFVEKLTLDDNDNPWFSVPGVGVVGYFPRGTIEDPSDDVYKILDDGENTGALPNKDVTDIVLGTDGKLWITTSLGFSILSNPSGVAEASYGNYNTYRPKIDYEGDTEHFLGETYITCGTSDGGNRKWLGTDNAGLFCLKEDGYGIEYEFNTNNSKLISNTIYDVEFNGRTGELFVLTDKGLTSLRVDASDGRDNYNDVIVFPNPVHPEYEGVVTIQGIKTDSDVKVTDMAGNIVYETRSQGGTATWNCRKVTGEKVATGVYLIWTAPNEGKGRKVGQVTVIR